MKKNFEKILALQTKVQTQLNNKKLKTALNTQLQALKLSQDLKEPKLTAILYQKTGKILEQQDELQKALYAYEAAFRALNDVDDNLEDTIKRLRIVSKSFSQDNDIEVPDVFSPEMKTAIEEAMQNESLNIDLLHQIGNSYFYQPQLNPALNVYQQILVQKNIEKQPLLKAQALVKIGEIFRQQKNIDGALEKINAAFTLLNKHGEEMDKTHAYALQARLLFQQNKTDLAIPIYEKAITLLEKDGDYENAGKVYAQLGQLYLGQEEFAKANEVYQKALSFTEKLQGNLAWHVYWGLGCCAAKTEDWSTAAAYLEQSIAFILKRQNKLYTDEGKVAFLESVQDVFNKLIEVYLHVGGEAAIRKALDIAEDAKGQSLDDMMDGKKRRRASRVQNAGRNIRSMNSPGRSNAPMQQMSMGTEILPDRNLSPEEDLNKLLDNPKFAAGMDIMRQAAPGTPIDSFANVPEESLLPEEQQQTVADDIPEQRKISKRCFLFFYKLDNQLLIWLKKPDGKTLLHKSETACEEIARKVNSLRLSILKDAESRGIDVSRGVEIQGKNKASRSVITRDFQAAKKNFKELAKELYQILILPFESEIKTEENGLVLVPHNFLWLLPFSVLMNAKEAYLGEKYPLIFAPSLKALGRIDAEQPYSNVQNLKALIIGNPVMSKAHENYRFQPLKGAEEEAVALAKLFKVRPLLQNAATGKAVEEAVNSTNLLHLATHGLADEESPLDSFVVLADTFKADGSLEKDGLLKAREIMQWSLQCELVNLSACQTALGKMSGEGIIGLSRAFLIAGSRSVLVSLWNISDKATAAFMQEFYHHYLSSENKGIALQTAMKKMQTHPDYQHPVFWSAFTLVGSDS